MPSPFPGMDPYLENPARWPGVHTALIAKMAAMLNSALDPSYAVLVQERVYVSDLEDLGRRTIIPDLYVKQSVPQQEQHPYLSEEALQTMVSPIEVDLLETEIHDSYLEIVDTNHHHVVTTIEILSPTNKVRGARGRDEYLRKRREVLASPAHWVEIDLLRAGESSAPLELAHAGDYFVHVSRAERRPRVQFWPIRLPQRLPVVPVPLRNETSHAFDLQQLLDTVYDESPYRRLIDYQCDPVPPLSPHDATWADEWLKTQGIRPRG